MPPITFLSAPPFRRTASHCWQPSAPSKGRNRNKRIACGWIKYAVPTQLTAWQHLQRIAALFMPWPLLRPTFTDKGRAALRCEAHRLWQWRAAGLPVPRIVDVGEDYLITVDAGPALPFWLEQAPTAGHRIALLRQAAQVLATVHRAGFSHGRPSLKDIAFDGTRLTFLDLEESPTSVMPLSTAQARDVLLFFSSASTTCQRLGQPTDLSKVWQAYLEAQPPASTLRVAKRNYRLLRLVTLPLRMFPRRWLGHDAKGTLQVLTARV